MNKLSRFFLSIVIGLISILPFSLPAFAVTEVNTSAGRSFQYEGHNNSTWDDDWNVVRNYTASGSDTRISTNGTPVVSFGQDYDGTQSEHHYETIARAMYPFTVPSIGSNFFVTGYIKMRGNDVRNTIDNGVIPVTLYVVPANGSEFYQDEAHDQNYNIGKYTRSTVLAILTGFTGTGYASGNLTPAGYTYFNANKGQSVYLGVLTSYDCTGTAPYYDETSTSYGQSYVQNYNNYLTFGYTTSATEPIFTPTAPSNLTLTWDFGNHGLYLDQWCPKLNWTDNSDNETTWVVQKATDSAFTQNAVTFEWWGSGLTSPSVPPLYDIVSAWATGNPSTLYYRVAAKNEFGQSAWCTYASLAVNAGYADIVPRVQNLVADAVHIQNNEPSYIYVHWDAYIGSATGFYIQRCDNQNFTGIIYHFLNVYENNPIFPTLNDDGYTGFVDIYGIGNLNQAGSWYYRIMARNILGENTVVINTNPNSPAVTVVGSNWSNIASTALTTQNIEDINIFPQPTIPPTTAPNPFPIDFDFNAAWFPYVALVVSMLLCFAIPTAMAHGSQAGIIIGGALAAVDFSVFAIMDWINPLIPIAILIALGVIFLVPRITGDK